MFEDLVPSASAQTSAPPPGLFDDLIPAGGAAGVAQAAKVAAPGGADEPALPRSTAGTDPGDERIEAPARNGQLAVALSGQTNAGDATSAPPGLFDDLIPAAARSGGAVGGAQGAVAPEYEPVPDPWLGLKDRKTGIPLVRESLPGPFIAEVAGADDGGLFWKHPQTGEIQRPSGHELIRPEGGKYKVYERLDNVRPWTWTDMGLIQAIKSGVSAPYDALAGNMAPNEVAGRALDTASLAVPGTTFTPWRIRPPASPEPKPRPLSADVPDFGSGGLRIAGKALDSARQSLIDMFEAATREGPKENRTVDLGMMTPEGADRLNGVLREAGIDTDVAGFRHMVDSYSARHSFARHGDMLKEAAQGQVALTPDDWAMIPTVLSSPDHIRVIGRTRHGLDAIGYWKRVNGLIYYIEEVRTGRESLAAVTMQKFKVGEPGVSGVPGGPDRLAPPRSTAKTDPDAPNISEPEGDR
jgi:Barnase-EndoU-ColicinE5/D-RelE like nuclease